MQINQTIIDSLTTRRAIRKFDVTKKVSESDLKTILESAILAPTSYGLEPWKCIVVTNPEVRQQLRLAGYDQPKITEASHLLVIARRTDSQNLVDELVSRVAVSQDKKTEELEGFKGMVEGAFTYKPEGPVRDGWLAAQSYIALGVMVETASLLGIDNAPMEGFDAVKVSEILGLPAKNLMAVTMLALGYMDESDTLTPKVRRGYTDAIEFV